MKTKIDFTGRGTDTSIAYNEDSDTYVIIIRDWNRGRTGAELELKIPQSCGFVIMDAIKKLDKERMSS